MGRLGTDDTIGNAAHYPKVVLVTGACRFLGGYLTARLAQNPMIKGIIAVDAIAPSKDMLRRMGRAKQMAEGPESARAEPAPMGRPSGARACRGRALARLGEASEPSARSATRRSPLSGAGSRRSSR